MTQLFGYARNERTAQITKTQRAFTKSGVVKSQGQDRGRTKRNAICY